MRAAWPWLVLALLVGGCSGASSEDDRPDPGPPAFVDPIDPYHDHSVAADHNFSTPSMRRLAYDALGPEGKPFRYIGEIDAYADWAFVAVEGGRAFPEDVAGFVVVNVADPTRPTVVARAESPYSTGHDVKVSPTGDWLYQASQWGDVPPPPTAALEGPVAAYNNGILIWDVSDKSAPRLAGFTPVHPIGCHMVAVGLVAGSEYVFCAATLRGLQVFRAEDLPTGRALVPVALWKPGAADAVLYPHDMHFQADPVTGDPILVVSHIDQGVFVLDVSNPASPAVLAQWGGEGARNWHGQIHSAIATLVGQRRIVVATPELYTNETASVFVLDATDYATMRLAAEWVNPGNHSAFYFALTTHQFQLVGQRLYLSHNHGGVWVLDLQRVLNGTHGVLGYYLPHEQAFPEGTEGYFVPHVWDVVVHRGAILASDRLTGLYVLHYEEDALGPPAFEPRTGAA